MTNEFGIKLDRNGYAPSIIPYHGETRCFICGRNGLGDKLDRHEIFGGSNRTLSKNLGLWVYLCHRQCHQFGPDSVHQSAYTMRQLHIYGQMIAEIAYGWTHEDFIRRFGKNYIAEE